MNEPRKTLRFTPVGSVVSQTESVQLLVLVRPIPWLSTCQLTIMLWPLEAGPGTFTDGMTRSAYGIGITSKVPGEWATLFASAPSSNTASVPSALTKT